MTSAQATAAIIYLDVWSRRSPRSTTPSSARRRSVARIPRRGSRPCGRSRRWSQSPDGGGGFACGDTLKAWDDLTAPSTGALNARAQPAPRRTAHACCRRAPASAGWRINCTASRFMPAGPLEAARSNGPATTESIVTTVDRSTARRSPCAISAGDDALGFASGQWVEISDDIRELSGSPGQLVQIDRIDVANRVITARQAVTGIDAAAGPGCGAGRAPARPGCRSWCPRAMTAGFRSKMGSR